MENKKFFLAFMVVAILLYVYHQSTDPSRNIDEPANRTLRQADEAPRQFDGYACREDCSGHEAGYRWAEEHDITDVEDCEAAGEHSNSPSFAEGCESYVNGEGDPQESDDNEDDSEPNE